MEWTLDGRLLVSEQQTGMIKDITNGGDARTLPPIAWGLGAPAAIVPLRDGRVLVADMRFGCVWDVARGGDCSETEPFAHGLTIPYNVVAREPDGELQVLVSEDISIAARQYTDITRGGGPESHRTFITNIPSRTIYQRVREIDVDLLRADDGGFADQLVGSQKCGTWGLILARGNGELVATASSMGLLVRTPDDGGEFMSFASNPDNIVAWGLEPMGGMKEHPWNGLIYISQPADGTVVAVDRTVLETSSSTHQSFACRRQVSRPVFGSHQTVKRCTCVIAVSEPSGRSRVTCTSLISLSGAGPSPHRSAAFFANAHSPPPTLCPQRPFADESRWSTSRGIGTMRF